ncbi:hypothetical protein PS2_003878 [Malus domestica]
MRTLVWNVRARAEMEPMSNVGEMEVERTPTITPIIPIAEHVQNNNIRARAEMEPMSNVGEMEFERTPTITPIIPIAEHVQNNVNEGK